MFTMVCRIPESSTAGSGSWGASVCLLNHPQHGARGIVGCRKRWPISYSISAWHMGDEGSAPRCFKSAVIIFKNLPAGVGECFVRQRTFELGLDGQRGTF